MSAAESADRLGAYTQHLLHEIAAGRGRHNPFGGDRALLIGLGLVVESKRGYAITSAGRECVDYLLAQDHAECSICRTRHGFEVIHVCE